MIIVKDCKQVAVQRKDLSYTYFSWVRNCYRLDSVWHETIDNERGNTQIAPITLAEW